MMKKKKAAKKVMKKAKKAAPKKKKKAAKKKKPNEKGVKFQEKIRLQKNSHSYFSALRRKYAKHFKTVEGPVKKIFKVFTAIIIMIVLFVAALYLTFGRDLPDVTKLKDMN